jgi:hypothetical protein
MAALLVAAAPPAPPAPATYDVTVRYRIVAFQNERVAQFNAMMKELAARGFQRDPNEEPAIDEAADARATRLHGTVSATQVRSLLLERHVRALLLVPAGEKLPEDANQPVRVNIELAAGLPPERQRLLHAQTVEALGPLKFSEAVAYDHRGFTRIVGSVPAGQVNALLNDLREQPPGRDLPAPFAVVPAVRIVEVRPELPPPSPRPNVPAVPAGHDKLSADLREAVAQPDRATKPTRLEVLLTHEPESTDRSWQAPLRFAAPGIVIEGLFGSVVTVVARPEQAPALAAVSEVIAVRLPRLARSLGENVSEMSKHIAAGLERLHTKGYRGKGSRIAIIASDFRGWEGLLGKGLPQTTQLIDLTRERNENFEPDPYPAGPGPGHGTLFARAVASAAPEADIVLIRVDPTTPYMLQTVTKAAAGELATSLALATRESQLDEDRSRLDLRRQELLDERRQVFEDLSAEGEPLKRRQDYQKKQAAFDQDEKDFQARLRRYITLQTALLNLKGVRIVASALADSSPQGASGSNVLSQLPDGRSLLWIQPADLWKGATWTGLYRDADGNGMMEFASPETPLPKDSWSRELNFLAWRAPDGKLSPELPAGSRVRVTFLWREPHDRALARVGMDPFREPLTAVRLLVLRQVDPSGAKRPADDMEIVAQSVGVPHRLDRTASSAMYEVSVEWRVPEAGRYALRVEGRLPESDRPGSLPVLPSQRRSGEIHPRAVLDTLEGTGHAVWRDYHGETDGVGSSLESP